MKNVLIQPNHCTTQEKLIYRLIVVHYTEVQVHIYVLECEYW